MSTKNESMVALCALISSVSRRVRTCTSALSPRTRPAAKSIIVKNNKMAEKQSWQNDFSVDMDAVMQTSAPTSQEFELPDFVATEKGIVCVNARITGIKWGMEWRVLDTYSYVRIEGRMSGSIC